MKLMLLPMLLALVLFPACNSSNDSDSAADDNSTESAATTDTQSDYSSKRYSVESIIVKYELSGDQNGTEELYFDHWGMREAKYTSAVSSFGGSEQKENKIEILDGKYQYTIDLTTMTGTKSLSLIVSMAAEAEEEDHFIKLAKRLREEMGGKLTGTESILGKECEVWEMKDYGTTAWIWNGVTLKIEMDMGIKKVKTAVSVEAGGSIPSEKFDIPDGVTMTDEAAALEQ